LQKFSFNLVSSENEDESKIAPILDIGLGPWHGASHFVVVVGGVTLRYVTERYITKWYVTKRYVTKRYVTKRYVTKRILLQNGTCYKMVRYNTVHLQNSNCHKTVHVPKRYVSKRYVLKMVRNKG
jgi:putative transposon-encoded protein